MTLLPVMKTILCAPYRIKDSHHEPCTCYEGNPRPHIECITVIIGLAANMRVYPVFILDNNPHPGPFIGYERHPEPYTDYIKGCSWTLYGIKIILGLESDTRRLIYPGPYIRDEGCPRPLNI